MNYTVDFFLCLLLGFFGGHKFYEKKYGMGVLYLFTIGLFGFGWMYDTIKLFIVAFVYDTDKQAEYAKREEEKANIRQQEYTSMQSNKVKNNEAIINRKAAAREAGQACCPYCGSTSLSANKKGFGLIKGAAGVMVAGPVGVVAAGHGKNKVIVTCLNCGKQFKPGKR